jgi:hypothetical protein
MNFDEFKKPLPTDPDEISRGIDGLLKPAQFFEPRYEEDRDEIDAKIREVSFNQGKPARLPTLEEALGMTPEQEKDFQQSRDEGGGVEEEETPSNFPGPYDESPTDSETERDYKRRMRENQEREGAENRLYKMENIEETVREMVDPDFEISGRMLYSDALNFWPLPMTREQFNALETEMRKAIISTVPHYRQGYQDHQDEYLANNRNKFERYGSKTFEKEKAFGVRYIGRIMELSDSNQVRKYDKLVDEFNADRDRIVKEKNYDLLQEYLDKVRALVNEIK